MQKWVPYAMVRIALCFVCGILLAIYYPEILSVKTASVLLVCFVVAAIILFWFAQRHRKIKLLYGILAFAGLTVFGFVHLKQKTESSSTDHILQQKNITAYECIVRSAVESKTNSWKFYVDVVQVKTTGWVPASGKVVIYVSKKTIDQIPWLYGDHLLVKGSPQELRPPANPNEFDYKRFLSFRNVYHQQFLKAGQVQFVSPPARKGFIYYSHRVRDWASTVLSANIKDEQNQAVAMALVLGVIEGIDSDLLNAYAASGAMHVLAVSGMHVGIIYVIILFLFKPLNKYRWSAWLIAGISILLLWAFAFVTGLSPSVLRAVTMFSFVALAKPLGWRTNIYNTLAASAFVLLWYDPYLIMSVGFQLSYLAVLGIVYLQKPLYNLWIIDNYIGNWVWEITCISIAAQIATFALGMLYFHQFPVYFLVSNLFVIPLSTAVLVGGIILLMASAFSMLATLIGWMLEWLIEFLNFTVVVTEKMPYSIIGNIHISTLQCWLIMGILFSLILMFQYRNKNLIWTTVLLSVILIFTQAQYFNAHLSTNQFVVYSISNHSAMEWIVNGKSYYRADSALLQDYERTRFHVLPNRLQHGVRTSTTHIPFAQVTSGGFEIYSWKQNKIGVYAHPTQTLPPLDFLIIRNNSFPVKDTARLQGITKIILDGTNSSHYIARWKSAQEKKPWQVHAVADDGAFVIHF